MNKAMKVDLADLVDAIEHLQKLVENASLQTKIDVAAKLSAIIKNAANIQDHIKDEIKTQHGPYVLGEEFKALLASIQVTRLNQELLRVEYPRAYAKCLETKTQQRITFEVR